jgi:hypothetical protein
MSVMVNAYIVTIEAEKKHLARGTRLVCAITIIPTRTYLPTWTSSSRRFMEHAGQLLRDRPGARQLRPNAGFRNLQ